MTATPDLRLDRDPDFGTPRFVRRRGAFLSDPAPGAPAEAVAAAFVAANARTFTLAPSDIAPPNARVTRDVTTRHNGMRSLTWQQRKDGLDIFGATFALNLTADNRIINVQSRALYLAGVRFHGTVRITAENAAKIAEERLTQKNEDGNAQPAAFNIQRAAQAIWYPLDIISAVKAWDLIAEVGQELHRVIVRADTGAVVEDINLTWTLETASFNVYTNDSPVPTTPGSATPTNAVPVGFSRSLVVLPALDTKASPQGWIPAGDNRLVGNNANVYADWDDNNSADSSPLTGSPYRVFDRPCDLTLGPSNYVAASQVQAFYDANWFHDRLWLLGFDEAAGNFQTANFGRGGQGGDPLTIEVQNNLVAELGKGYGIRAWYSGYGDGSMGKVVVTVAGAPLRRDGALDAHVVLHEVTHGVSTRLIGNGFGLTTTQSRGLAEGWSDFFPLALLSEASDPDTGTYPFASYSAARFGQVQHAYFGMRRFPYCVLANKAPQTLADCDPNQRAFPPDVPIDTYYASDDADEIHNIGEIWCLMLWECRANLIERYGFAGNEAMLQLVVDGMKLTPENPTFVEARDAIFQADLVNNGGANQVDLWRGFAKRGLGWSATVPPSVSTVGIAEGYDLPFAVRARVAETAGDGDGYVEPGESGQATIDLTTREMSLSGLTAALSALSSNVTVTVSNAALADVAVGGTSTSSPPFVFTTDAAFPGNTDAGFLLRVQSDRGAFDWPLAVRVGNPWDYPPAIADIEVTDLGETNAWIAWTTGIPADGHVDYGASTNYGMSTAPDPVMRTNHLARIDGLARGTVYHFRVVSEGTNGLTAASGDMTLRTRSRVYVFWGSTATQELGTAEAPFKSLQAAAEAAKVYDDDILVAEGTYTSAQVEAVVDLDGSAWDLTIEGGYAPDFSVRDPEALKTVIDGQRARRGVRLDNGAKLSISGVTITHGQGEWGGGVHVRKSRFDAEDCMIEDNASTDGVNTIGGGVYGTLASSVSLRACQLRDNIAGEGGGIFMVSSGTMLEMANCTFLDNSADYDGGGLRFELAAGGEITGSGFYRNLAEIQGAGITVAPFCTVALSLSTVSSNWVRNATDQDYMGGGGILVAGGPNTATLLVHNSIIYGNRGQYGADLRCSERSQVNVTHCDIGDIHGALTTSNNVISADPLFADPAAGDFHLLYGSPCIDVGSTNAGGGLLDLDGEPRPFGPAMDMGADEFTDADGDHMADYWERARFGSTAASDGTSDADGDGLGDFGEYMHQTDPQIPDTDGDGMPDGWEVGRASDPRADDALLDLDGDGMCGLAEYVADTDPRSADSVLRLLRVRSDHGGLRLEWKGGEQSWQFLDVTRELIPSNGWTALYGLPPPTPTTNAVVIFGITNRTQFFRIRAERSP